MMKMKHAGMNATLIAVIGAALFTVGGPRNDVAAQETQTSETAKTRDGDPKSEKGLSYQDPQGFMPLRQAQRHLQRPRPRQDHLVPLQLLPVADGHHVQRARAVSTQERGDRRRIDGVDVSQRQRGAGQLQVVRQRRSHLSLLPSMWNDSLLGHCRRTGPYRNRNRHPHRPDVSTSKRFPASRRTGTRGR